MFSPKVRTEEGMLQLFGAIDRTSKFAYAELHKEADKSLTDHISATRVWLSEPGR